MITSRILPAAAPFAAGRVAFAIALGLIATALSAAPGDGLPDIAVFAHARKVSDEVLGNARGRFSGGGRIIRFGVEMVSTWENHSGEKLRAAANLNVDFRKSEPKVKFQPLLTVVNAGASGTPSLPSVGAGTVTGAGGVNNVSGVAQAIQVAGDANAVVNNTTIRVSQDPIPYTSGPTLSGPQSTTVTTPSGASATATLANNVVGVSITVPNEGEVRQEIRGQDIGGQGATGVVQLARVTGDLQSVQNSMSIRVQLDPNTVAGSINRGDLRQALNSLRGLRPAGAF